MGLWNYGFINGGLFFKWNQIKIRALGDLPFLRRHCGGLFCVEKHDALRSIALWFLLSFNVCFLMAFWLCCAWLLRFAPMGLIRKSLGYIFRGGAPSCRPGNRLLHCNGFPNAPYNRVNYFNAEIIYYISSIFGQGGNGNICAERLCNLFFLKGSIIISLETPLSFRGFSGIAVPLTLRFSFP